MTANKTPWWCWLSIFVTAALSLFSLSYRHRAESRNKAVSIAVEMEAVHTLAASQGISIADALAHLKQQGLRAVVLSEETIAQLENEGAVAMGPLGVTVLEPLEIDRVERGTSLRFPLQNGLPASLPNGLERTAAVGLDPKEAAQVRNADLDLIARFANPLGATDAYVQGTLEWAEELGAIAFLPMGDQVLGRRDSLDATVGAMKRLGILYASPEFTKIGGDASVVAKAPEIVLRLHSAQTAELDRLPMSEAVERYAKAARERNMRVLLLRPLANASAEPVYALGAFVKAVASEVQKDGMTVASAHPFVDPGVPRWLPPLIALAALPLVFWAGCMLFLAFYARVVGGLVLALLAVGAWTSSGLQYAALAIATGFPIAAMAMLSTRRLKHPILEFLVTSLVSMVGGLAVAGMLNSLPFLVKADAFPGVKLAVFLPVAAIGYLYFARLGDLKQALRDPVTWGASALGLLVIAVLGFMVLRTGNEASATVSPLELQARNLLDAILPVRPRTKEFLIGHPALILGIGLLALAQASESLRRKWGGWTALALIVGTIGQTSIVNTLCHLHTPVALSVLRIGTGIVLGSIIGALLWLVASKRLPREVLP